MSDESVIYKEDVENLLYISRKIQLEEQYAFLEEHNYVRKSLTSQQSEKSTTSTVRLGSDANFYHEHNKHIGPDYFYDPQVTAKTRPFDLKWTYGINAKVGIRNLTTANRRDIFFVSCHSPIIYNYCTKEMKNLEAHQLLIKCISADKSGRWLVTASGSKEGCFIVWDSIEYKAVFSKFGPYPGSGILFLEISGSARYLITIGTENEGEDYNVDFWLWTLGNDKPDGSFKADKNSGLPVAICFNPDVEEHIMVAFQKHVYLVVWDAEAKTFTVPVSPHIVHKHQTGNLTDATYLNSCHECYASSQNGCLLIFGNTLYPKPFAEGELDNTKIFRNIVRVSPVPIGCCTTIDGLLVTGDTRGYIFFFDSRVRILYWLRNYSLASITSISFNSVPKFKYQDAHVMYRSKFLENRVFECDYEDITNEIEIILKQELPTDATLRRNSFVVNDFVVATTDSNIYTIDCVHDKCTPLFFIADDYVSAIEVHDELLYIIIGYANGRLMMIDYEKNYLINTTILPATSESGDLLSISCLKYSSGSLHLVCGRQNGEIWVLEPILLIPKITTPFRPTKFAPLNLKFAACKTQFAYYVKY